MAIDEAAAEDLYWTPMLDAFAHHQTWTGEGSRLSDLLDWVESSHDPTEIVPLLEFRSDLLRRRVLGSVRIHTPEFCDAVQSHGLRALIHYASNPSLPADIVDRLARHALRIHLSEFPGWGDDTEFSYEDHQGVPKLVAALAGAKHLLPADVCASFVDGPVRGQHLGPALSIIRTLHVQLTLADLERLADRDPGAATTMSLIAHPVSTPEFRVRLLKRSSGRDLFLVRRGVVKDPLLRGLPEVREHLLSTTSIKVLEPMLDTDDPEWLDAVLRRVIMTQIRFVVEAIIRDAQDARSEEPKGSPAWVERAKSHFADLVAERAATFHAVTLIRDLFATPFGHAHPIVRDLLSKHRFANSGDLLAVLRDARGDEMRTISARLRDKDHRSFFELIEKGEAPGLVDLTPEVVAPLLASPTMAIRQRAILALGKLHAQEPEQERSLAASRPTASLR